jgi:hypothetical protein
MRRPISPFIAQTLSSADPDNVPNLRLLTCRYYSDAWSELREVELELYPRLDDLPRWASCSA